MPSTQKILVPVDFTELSYKVIEQAAQIANASGQKLILFHIADKNTDIDLAKSKLTNKAVETAVQYNVLCDSKVVAGSIYVDIQSEAEANEYSLLVIGTHGIRGLKQKLLGADILKVITKIPVPVLVVQSTSPFKKEYKKIILPAATHESYENILQAVLWFGEIFHAEVHVYSIEKPGFEWPDTLKRNLEKAKKLFSEKGINFVRVNEKPNVLSIGFAPQTVKYAQKIDADVIAIMSVPSEEYHYFAQQDKENLLTNEGGIPVLCASNLSLND